MAINSTSSATSASTTSTSGVGKGSVIDVESIVSKLDSIEQAPIDKLSVKVTSQDNSIRDLGIIKDKMALFQAALQDFTDPISYLSKTVASSNSTVLSASISQSTAANSGIYSISVQQIAKTSTKSYAFDFSQAGSFTLQTIKSDGLPEGSVEPFNISASGTGGIDSLEKLRVAINQSTSSSKVRASIVNIGTQSVLSLTSTTGGGDSQVELLDSTGRSTLTGFQDGLDAEFTINGQEFTRASNIVDEAIPGVRLQLQAVTGGTDISLAVTSDNSVKAQTLLTNLGQAYNDLMASYSEFSKFNSDTAKRGSLYGYMDLRSLIDSISVSFMTPLTRSGTPLRDTSGNLISFTSLGLELQLDGTLLFDSAIYESAMNHGALDQLANGSVSPTRTIVNTAMTFGGKVDSFISAFEDQKSTLENRIQDMQTRKADKMARYQAQYAALDALLYRLQALNSSLTPTFTALNNQKNN
jgi:flagellar hook-associated protein 2